jgi:serine/threonine protein kinase/tetratricopeptide (TPR) repeat protein
MTEPSLPEESLFAQALEIATAAERAAFLDRACADNPVLRAEVEALLRAHERSGDLLDLPESLPATADLPARERPGTVLGPYKLLEQIGEGGMGTVWMAQQAEPIRRRVAVKVVKEGMDSRQVLARFEAERQALALMEHPNIARVLDAGRTSSGRPYFVMELVKGQPITQYCDEKRLGVRERLNLFGDICGAVRHAHQKGIIHRDLKPSNVLVAPYDGKPVVKVIDFGVAKATGQRLTDMTLFTGFGALVGTPEYMSPEQAEVNNQDIDTRSDIYALGVLLYELLTGSTPLTRERVKGAALLEVLRVIREEEPPRPSTRLSESAESLPSISAQRQTEPARLTKLVRGELDWIVMKALEKDRSRRYETASAFAADVQRYLADESVQACPPSASYRLRKFLRRNKGPVLAVTVVGLALVGGIVGTTWELLRAERAVAAEKTANEITNKRLTQIEKGNDIIAGIFTDLDTEDVTAGDRPVEAMLAERLVQAADQLEGEAVGEPFAVAALQQRLGRSLMSLGFADRALPILQKSRQTLLEISGRDHPATLSTAANLAQCYLATGKLDLALSLFKELLPIIKSQLGPDHPDTLGCMNGLAETYMQTSKNDLALPLLEEALRLRKARLGPDDPATLTSMNNLAVSYEFAGRFDRSLPLKEETLKLEKARFGPDHPKTIVAMNNLAEGYRVAGQVDRALKLFKETLTLAKTRLGPYHPQTLIGMNNVGFNYHHKGKPELARPLLEDAYRLMKVKLGPDHFQTLNCMGNLANCYRDMNKLDLALPLYEEVLPRTKAKFGPDNPRALGIMHDVAKTHLAAGKLDLARPLFEETFQRMKANLGPDHSDTLACMSGLAEVYRMAGKHDLALPLFVENLERTRAKFGPDHLSTLNSMNNLANGYARAGKLDLALPLYEEAFRRMKANLGPDYPNTLTCMNGLATCYRTTGKLDLAVPLFEEILRRREAIHGRQHAQTLLAVANLGATYASAGRLEQALPLLEEAYKASASDANLRWVGSDLLRGYTKAGTTTQAAALAKELLSDARRTLPADSTQLAARLTQLGVDLMNNKAFADAEQVFRDALTIRAKRQPDRWTTFNIQSLLGWALLGQKQYAAAEPLLLASYKGMKEREKSIPPTSRARLPEAADRLVALYTATNKPDELKKWQAERGTYPRADSSSPPEKK